MADTEGQVEVQLTSNSPPGSEACLEVKEISCPEELLNNPQTEVDDSLVLLADAALAPPCGDITSRSCNSDACSCLEVKGMEGSVQSQQSILQFLMSKADDLHNRLVNGQSHFDKEAPTAALQSFLYTCQPYFIHLESSARSTVHECTPLSTDAYTRRVQLLDLSQQLCDKLEKLVLTYTSYGLLCLDETELNCNAAPSPTGSLSKGHAIVSHFYVGQFCLSQILVTTFRYSKPTPYLARVNTGLYKRMRWNVQRLEDEVELQTDKEHRGESDNTEYYFLCYEDSLPCHAESDRNIQSVPQSNMVRMWSIGKWVQVEPNPGTEDIYEWILCEVPKANYQRLLMLGTEEPSCCRATDLLQQLLLSDCKVI